MTLQEQTEAAHKTIASIRKVPNFKGSNFNSLIRRTCSKYGTDENYIRKVAGWTKRPK